MAISYVRYTMGTAADLAAAPAAGGSLLPSTQYWFVIIPIPQNYWNASSQHGAPSNIATATTDVTNKTINLTWTAVPTATHYMVYWTTTDPAGNVLNFNSTGNIIHNGNYSTPVATNSFSFNNPQMNSGTPYYSTAMNNHASGSPAIFADKMDRITIGGSVDADRATIEKTYQACVTNGWDSITKIGESTYYLATQLATSSANSVFESKDEVVLTKGNFTNSNSGSFTYLGTMTGNQDGSVWISLQGQSVSAGDAFYFRGARISNWVFKHTRQGYSPTTNTNYRSLYISGDDYQIINCDIERIQYLNFDGGAISSSYVKDSKISVGRWAIRFASNVSQATFSNVVSYAGGTAIYSRYSPTFSRVSATGTTSNNVIAITDIGTDEVITAYDCDISVPTGSAGVQWFYNGRAFTTNDSYKNYKTNAVYVKDSSGTVISGATVRAVDKDGTERMNTTTDANGLASAYVLAQENKPNTALAYTHYGTLTDYNPFTVTVSKDGYETEIFKLTLSAPKETSVTLKAEVRNLIDQTGKKYRRADRTNSVESIRKRVTR